MIRKSVVTEFKRKKLQDYSFLKSFSLSQIREEVSQVITGTDFCFKMEPYRHQLVSFFIGACKEQFLFFLDMGLGKTKILIDIIVFREASKTLVLVPSDINIEGWEEEIKLHTDKKCIPLYGTTIERWELLERKGNFFVINYQGLLHMVCRKNKKTNKFEIHKPNLLKLAEMFDALILDEIHMAKNNKAVTFKVLNALSDKITIRYGATGTPFGRNPLDLWSLFYIIDKGATLGGTLSIFKEAFFIKVIDSFGYYKHEFDKKYERHLFRRMHNGSIRYADDECQDLPGKIEVIKRFNLSKLAAKYFDQAVSGIIESNGDNLKIDNAYIRMRQISSGFLQLKDDEKNKLPIVHFPDNPKLELLKGMCLSLPLKRKMVIFLRYVPSGDMVCKMLSEIKFNYATAVGKTKNAPAEIKRFKKDPECRYLVASVDGGAGLGGNFQVANHVVFFESPESPIKRKQCYKRCHRGGQVRKVHITDLVGISGRLSVEQKILDFLEEGEDLFQALLEGRASLNLSIQGRPRAQLKVL